MGFIVPQDRETTCNVLQYSDGQMWKRLTLLYDGLSTVFDWLFDYEIDVAADSSVSWSEGGHVGRFDNRIIIAVSSFLMSSSP